MNKFYYLIIFILIISLAGCAQNDDINEIEELEPTAGLEYIPINETECAVSVGEAISSSEIVVPSKYNEYIVTEVYGDENGGGFAFCTNLSNIVLPNTIKLIGKKAFYGCTNLTNIRIPNSVTTIEEYAFYDCKNLKYCDIPSSVITISESAFTDFSKTYFYCEAKHRLEGWENHSWPNSKYPIYWDININNCYEIDDFRYLVDNKSKTATVLQYLGSDNEVDIKSTIKTKNGKYTVSSIGKYVFHNSKLIERVNIPNSIINIKYPIVNGNNIEAFYCESETIPEGWSSYFKDYYALVYWGVNDSNLYENDGIEYLLDYNTSEATVLRFIGDQKNLVIKETVVVKGKTFKITSIGNCAFYNCEKLETLKIPNSISTINSSAIWNINKCLIIYFEAKEEKYNLTNSLNNKKIKVYYDVAANDYLEENGFWYVLNNETNEATLTKCTNTSSNIIIPEIIIKNNVEYKVTSIGDFAFNKIESLKTIDLPSGLKYIGNSCFESCLNLESAIIPNNVISLGESLFKGCRNLSNVVLPDTIKEISSSMFSSCSSLTTIEIPNTVTSIGSGAFSNCNCLTEIIIPNNVVSIEHDAFSNCNSLTEIIIPNNVVYIGHNAFSYCTNLENIVLSENITIINYHVFYNCKKLQTIIIPDGVKYIGEAAFFSCVSLKNIIIPDSVTTIESFAFSQCNSLENIVLSKTIKEIGAFTFANCISLKSIILPNGVKYIFNNAFENCTSLTSIVIPDSVLFIEIYAFENCSKLTVYCEKTTQPSTWQYDWINEIPVYWAGQWKYDIDGNPVILNTNE